ncbi:hypothetical protein RRG08_006956 [Elysia crispata]|uniref:Uncharacterized protein n=1 Tax=Elysia crispata TaxID=231223 RepID=A0AAE0XSE2_9GAST|nr:hypothetical protein RRG08_006956 [Elysia crispata]
MQGKVNPCPCVKFPFLEKRLVQTVSSDYGASGPATVVTTSRASSTVEDARTAAQTVFTVKTVINRYCLNHKLKASTVTW